MLTTPYPVLITQYLVLTTLILGKPGPASGVRPCFPTLPAHSDRLPELARPERKGRSRTEPAPGVGGALVRFNSLQGVGAGYPGARWGAREKDDAPARRCEGGNLCRPGSGKLCGHSIFTRYCCSQVPLAIPPQETIILPGYYFYKIDLFKQCLKIKNLTFERLRCPTKVTTRFSS